MKRAKIHYENILLCEFYVFMVSLSNKAPIKEYSSNFVLRFHEIGSLARDRFFKRIIKICAAEAHNAI